MADDMASNKICELKMQTLIERIEKIEEYEKSVQEAKMAQFSEAIMRFNFLLEKHEETIDKVMQETRDNRKENQRIHEERDRIMQSFATSLLEVSNSMTSLSSTVERLDNKITEMDSSMKVDLRLLLQKSVTQLLLGALSGGVFFMIMSYFSKK